MFISASHLRRYHVFIQLFKEHIVPLTTTKKTANWLHVELMSA